MFFQNCIAIDIQDDRVATVGLRASYKDVKLLGFETLLLDGESFIEKRSLVVDFIFDFIKDKKILSPNIHISIPREKVVVKFIDFPAAVKENFRETIRLEISKYVPFSVQDVYFDCQIVEEQAQSIKVLLAVVKKEILAPYLDFVEGLTNIGVSGLGINLFAMPSTLLCSSSATQSCVLAYIKRSGLQINLFKNGKVCGSKYLSSQQIKGAPEDALSQELLALRGSLGLGEESLRVVVGGDSDVIGDMHIANGDKIDISSPALPEGVPSSEYLSAYGLAQQGLCKAVTKQINFLPVGRRKKVNLRGYYFLLALLLAVIIMSFSLGGGLVMQQRLIYNNLDNEISRLSQEAIKLEGLEGKFSYASERIDYLNNAEKQRTLMLDTLKELSRLLPTSAWVNGLKRSGDSMTIEGFSEKASEIIQVLDTSPLFEEVAFLTTVSKDASGSEHFKIGFKINQRTRAEAR